MEVHLDGASMDELAKSVDNQHLELILLPTEKCNFGCLYCYENFLLGKMPPGVVEGVKNLIERRGRALRTLNLSWFGGEPLLSKDVIVDILESAVRSAQRHRFRLSSNMTTNGSLLDYRTAERFSALGLRHYQISLDGVREQHDRTRVGRNGGKTFDAIWRNLLSIRDGDVDLQVLIRLHYTVDTLERLDEALGMIHEEFGEDDRFAVTLKAVGRWGSEHDDQVSPLTFSREAEQKVSEHYQGRHSGMKQNDRTHYTKHMCYAGKGNSFVIRSDGAVNKCTLHLDDPRNSIGFIYPDGRLELDTRKFAQWIVAPFSGGDEAFTCPYTAFSSGVLEGAEAR